MMVQRAVNLFPMSQSKSVSEAKPKKVCPMFIVPTRYCHVDERSTENRQKRAKNGPDRGGRQDQAEFLQFGW
jgi:hypothetical protein